MATKRKTPLQDAPGQSPARGGQDPVLAMLAAAAVDDEPVSDDDRRLIAEGRQAYREGQIVSAEEVRQACRDASSGAAQTGTNQAIPA